MAKNLEAKGRALAWSLAAQRLKEDIQQRDDWSPEQAAHLASLVREFYARADEAECLVGNLETRSGG